MRIVTFNVNGLRSIKEYYRVSRGWNFDQFLDSLKGDIICFQEHKVNAATKLDREYALPSNYTAYYSFLRNSRRIGYSGVVTWCRSGWRPRYYEDGFTGVDYPESNKSLPYPNWTVDTATLQVLDGEARCIITDHGPFVLLNIYFPNDSGPERLAYRLPFYTSVIERCRTLLEAGYSIIVTGDFNVTFHPQDHCDYAPSYRKLVERYGREVVEKFIADPQEAGLIDSSSREATIIKLFLEDKALRRWFYNLLYDSELKRQFGLRDIFRALHPTSQEQYTCWNTMVGARGTNHGTRIDSFLVGGPLFQSLPTSSIIKECQIMSEFMGSDHCPVYLELELPLPLIQEPMLPQNLTGHTKQKRLSEFFERRMVKDESTDTTNQDPIDDNDIAEENAHNIGSKRPKPTAYTSALKLTDFFPLKSSTFDPSPQPSIRPTTSDVKKEDSASLYTQWQDLFKGPPPPPCCNGHREPCKLLTVNKKGPNQGRKFYVCSRGVGPKDDPQARCEHFEWLNKDKRAR